MGKDSGMHNGGGGAGRVAWLLFNVGTLEAESSQWPQPCIKVGPVPIGGVCRLAACMPDEPSACVHPALRSCVAGNVRRGVYPCTYQCRRSAIPGRSACAASAAGDLVRGRDQQSNRKVDLKRGRHELGKLCEERSRGRCDGGPQNKPVRLRDCTSGEQVGPAPVQSSRVENCIT